MISKPLLKQTIRENWMLWLVLTLVQAVLLLILGAIANVAATGVAYYNMLPEILSAIYVIITGNKLIAAQVDKGTLAYVLSTPIKRTTVAITQAFYLVGSLFFMSIISAGTHLIATQFLNSGLSSDDFGIIVKLNLGVWVLSLAYGGICYLASCVFNLSKYAIAVGGGIVGVSLLLPIISMFSDKFDFLKNFSLSALFDAPTIISGSSDYIANFVILAVIGFMGILVGSQIFVKKDLPL
ncbi:ABC transporter permease [Enterococcus sp. RIT-PI-f]|uniref:ABC transporter permease n=1 Tax=Enterococcus sp. RIT-PI-f TaxID=1690244 RepID=UPI0006B9EBF3|nr:ABC transporter permease [Enterococcus sp. RIT-PI-f]